MSRSVVVWGTGNVGRPAIRAVLSHAELELKAVIVANPDKVGRDAGALAGVGDCGVSARSDWRAVLDEGADALVYSATADTRPEEAMAELLAKAIRDGRSTPGDPQNNEGWPNTFPAKVLELYPFLSGDEERVEDELEKP